MIMLVCYKYHSNIKYPMSKILLICPYSYPSACGIWKRVEMDARAFRNAGHEVHIFSSNKIKSTNKTSAKEEEYFGVKLHRFKIWFNLGANAIFFFFQFQLLRLRPGYIFIHGYRYPHSLMGVIIGKLIGAKVFLTPHGPFYKDPSRSSIIKVFDRLYDILIGWWELKLYKKIIRIAQWEINPLKKRFVPQRKTVFIPHAIDDIFLNQKSKSLARLGGNPYNNLLFMGRLDPVKRLDWVEYLALQMPQYQFEIIGTNNGFKPSGNLHNLLIDFHKYDSKEFINKAQKADIFLMPSIRESFGITMLEAMSQGCIVVSSNTLGASEFIQDGYNGYIVTSKEEMLEKIKNIYQNWHNTQNIRVNAIETAQRYGFEKLSRSMVGLL